MNLLKQFITGLSTTLLLTLSSLAMAQNKTELQWFGQAAFKITTPGGKVIMIDPWLVTNPKTPERFKKLESLGKVDVILVSHGHFDHFADVPALAKLNNAPRSRGSPSSPPLRGLHPAERGCARPRMARSPRGIRRSRPRDAATKGHPRRRGIQDRRRRLGLAQPGAQTGC